MFKEKANNQEPKFPIGKKRLLLSLKIAKVQEPIFINYNKGPLFH